MVGNHIKLNGEHESPPSLPQQYGSFKQKVNVNPNDRHGLLMENFLRKRKKS